MNHQQASHFCQLLINDGESIMPLSAHAKKVVEPNDSMTNEQLFVKFLMQDDNWQSLCLFPHQEDNGTIVWYAPADALPASLGAEHQKYIREVFPRLQQEIETGNWENVDAYIDMMLKYQCQFGGTQLASSASSGTIIGIFLFISVLIILCRTIFFRTFAGKSKIL